MQGWWWRWHFNYRSTSGKCRPDFDDRDTSVKEIFPSDKRNEETLLLCSFPTPDAPTIVWTKHRHPESEWTGPIEYPKSTDEQTKIAEIFQRTLQLTDQNFDCQAAADQDRSNAGPPHARNRWTRQPTLRRNPPVQRLPGRIPVDWN